MKVEILLILDLNHTEKIGKQLPNRANLKIFYHLIALVLGSNSAKCLRVTKRVKKIKFEGVWSELESKETFHRQ